MGVWLCYDVRCRVIGAWYLVLVVAQKHDALAVLIQASWKGYYSRKHLVELLPKKKKGKGKKGKGKKKKGKKKKK